MTGIPRYGDFLKKRNYSRGHGSLINRYVFVYPTRVVTGYWHIQPPYGCAGYVVFVFKCSGYPHT